MPAARMIEHDGQRMNLTQWADLLGIRRNTLWHRLRTHPVEVALQPGPLPRPGRRPVMNAEPYDVLYLRVPRSLAIAIKDRVKQESSSINVYCRDALRAKLEACNVR